MSRFAIVLLLAACARSAPPVKVSHAAVAFRDDVPGYQKLASEKYTLHYLEGAYDSVDYVEATPTDDGEARMLAAIEAAAGKHDTVDLFFLSNSGRYDLWAAGLSAPARAKLRLVYNTGAGNAYQGGAWLKLGAQAYVGHPGGNIAPLFLTYFLPRWVKGVDLRTCVDDANKETKSDLGGSLARGVSGLLDRVGGPHVDPPKLWAGTEAQLYGDPTLVLK